MGRTKKLARKLTRRVSQTISQPRQRGDAEGSVGVDDLESDSDAEQDERQQQPQQPPPPQPHHLHVPPHLPVPPRRGTPHLAGLAASSSNATAAPPGPAAAAAGPAPFAGNFPPAPAPAPVIHGLTHLQLYPFGMALQQQPVPGLGPFANPALAPAAGAGTGAGAGAGGVGWPAGVATGALPASAFMAAAPPAALYGGGAVVAGQMGGHPPLPQQQRQAPQPQKAPMEQEENDVTTINLTAEEETVVNEREEKKRKQPDGTPAASAESSSSPAAKRGKEAASTSAPGPAAAGGLHAGGYALPLSVSPVGRPTESPAASPATGPEASAAAVTVTAEAATAAALLPPAATTTATESQAAATSSGSESPPLVGSTGEKCAALRWGIEQLQERISRLDKYKAKAEARKFQRTDIKKLTASARWLEARNAELRSTVRDDVDAHAQKLADERRAAEATLASLEAQTAAHLKKTEISRRHALDGIGANVERARAKETRMVGYEETGERALQSAREHRMKARASADAADANNIYAWREVQHLRSMLRAEREVEREFQRIQLEELRGRLERLEEGKHLGELPVLGRHGGKADHPPSLKPADVAGMMMVDLLRRDIVNLECMADCLRAEERKRPEDGHIGKASDLVLLAGQT